MNEILKVLMKRDGMSRKQAEAELQRVRQEFDATCDDPEEVLAYEFGLEPDYIFDLLEQIQSDYMLFRWHDGDNHGADAKF